MNGPASLSSPTRPASSATATRSIGWTAASASLATAEVLACIGDPCVWRGEIEAFTETLYREIYGESGVVVDVPDVADAVEPAGPVCRPGAVADGARPVRYTLHGGGLPEAARW